MCTGRRLALSVSDPFDIVDHMFDTVVRCGDQLAGIVARLDPDVLSGETAQSWWYALDRVERLAAGGKTLLARRLAATHSPSRSRQKSAADAMARDAGTSLGAAKDALNTSERLPELNKVEAAVRRGELSPAQAAVISEAAAADPSAQDRLLGVASKGSMSELREECARVKAAADPDPDATYRRIHAGRRVRHYTDPEGGWNLSARGTAQAGAAFLTVLNTLTDAIFRQARRHGRCEPVEAYAFDALMHLAEHTAGHCDGPPHTGDGAQPTGVQSAAPGEAAAATDESPGPAQTGDGSAGLAQARDASVGRPGEAGFGLAIDSAGDPGIFTAGRSESSGCAVRPGRSTNPRYLALLRVDVEALRRGRVAGDELCEIAGGWSSPGLGRKGGAG